MICISVAASKPEEIIKILKETNLAEIRLDISELSDNDIKIIFSQNDTSLIATCRAGKYTDSERMTILKKAITAGADYVDIEIETDKSYKKEIIIHARQAGCKVLISYHNYEITPDRDELIKIVNECYAYGADIAKIACMVNSKEDAARLISLYDPEENSIKPKSLISIGMGEMGKITRVITPILGSPFTFASHSIGKEMASGQIEYKTLKNILNLLSDL